MPLHDTIDVSRGKWVAITSGATLSLTFQNRGSNFLLIQGSVGAVMPTGAGAADGAIRYNPGQGESNAVLTDLFPGIALVDQAWAWAKEPTLISTSHA